MTFSLTINMHNAAFEDGGQLELARLLNILANQAKDEMLPQNGNMRDFNGNLCGEYRIED